MWGHPALSALHTAQRNFSLTELETHLQKEPRAGELLEGFLLCSPMVWWQQPQLQQGAAFGQSLSLCWGIPLGSGPWGTKGTALKEMGKDRKEREFFTGRNKLSCDFILTLFALVVLTVHPLVA